MAAETLDDVIGAVDSVPADLAAFMPDAPPLVGVGWVAETYGVTTNTVYLAIRSGRLPAFEVPGKAGAHAYVMRPEHAFKVWGSRLIHRALHGKPASRRKSTQV